MTWTILAGIVAGAALVAVGVLVPRLRAAAHEAAAARLDAERLSGELQTARSQLEKAEGKARRAGTELADVRKKLDKSRKRAAQLHGEARPGTPAASGLAAEKALEEARQARDAAREEAESLGAELSRLRAEQVAARRASEHADTTESEALERKVAASERELETAREALGKATAEVDRLKKKIRSQETLYVSIRSELEVKKDRIRAQTEEIERLHALKVALVDPIPPRADEADAVSEPLETASEAAGEQVDLPSEPEPEPLPESGSPAGPA